MTDLQSTHSHDCWDWGPKHYKCAVREIKALRAEVAAWLELSDRIEAVLDQLQAENERLRAEVERLNRILGRIVACDGDSNLTIRAGTDAFAAAREYLRPNT